jgi:NAD+ kinase
MVLTPLAAHTLSFRPLVLPPSTTIELTVDQANREAADGSGTTLMLDGQVQHPLFAGDVVLVRRAKSDLRLVSHPERTFWETLTQKMHWATVPGRPNGES